VYLYRIYCILDISADAEFTSESACKATWP